MHNLPIISKNNHFIKSWFGFFLGMLCVGISLLALIESFTLARILSTLGFLCFWYPWIQLTGLNRSIKNIFKNDAEPMNKLSVYLAFIALTLLIISTVLRFIS